MTLTTSPPMWIIPLLAGAAYLAYRLHNGRLSRPATRKANRLLAEKAGEAYSDALDLVRGTVSQIQHDGLTHRIRTLFSRVAQALETLIWHDARVGRFAEEHSKTLKRRDREIKANHKSGEKPPYLSPLMVVALNSTLIIGDISIVAMAIQASDATAGLFVATAGSLALAAALFVSGKALGDSLKRAYTNRFAAAVVALNVAAFSTGLYLIRLSYVEAWIILATAPALGAAGVSLLGPSRLQAAMHRSEKAAAKAGRQHERALQKKTKVAGRVAYMLTQARHALVASGYEAQSIAQMAGIQDAVTALETVANELGISLGDAFRHRPTPAVSPDVDQGPLDPAGTVSTETVAAETLDPPPNGEGTRELSIEDTSAFVPNLRDTPREEPS